MEMNKTELESQEQRLCYVYNVGSSEVATMWCIRSGNGSTPHEGPGIVWSCIYPAPVDGRSRLAWNF